MIKEADVTKNVFDENKGLLLITFFKNFYETHGPELSSKLIYAAYYLKDSRSELVQSGMTEDEIVEDLSKNLLDGINIHDYQELIDEYDKRCKTTAERLLQQWEQELKDRDELLRNWKWDKATAADKDKLIKATPSLWDQYLQIKAKVKEEAKEQSLYGNAEMSFFEQIGNAG